MYEIEFSREARRRQKRLPRDLVDRIRAKLSQIAADPYAQHNNVTALTGSTYFRLRIGDWRVIYDVQDDRLIILVIRIRPRGEAYR